MASRSTKRSYVLSKKGLESIRDMIAEGYNNAQIARSLGITADYFYTLMKQSDKLRDMVTEGKTRFDQDVIVPAFAKACTGQIFEEETRERVYNEATREYELVVTKVTKKLIQPNAGACLNWLKNRDPERWKDKQEVEHNGGVGVTIVEDL